MNTLFNICPDILEENNVDLIRVPRINTVTGITKEHIDRVGMEC
jgi:hypothetical protein